MSLHQQIPVASGHTPGPWVVSGVFIGPRLNSDSGILIKVARIVGPETDDEAIANARLIAAAPEMLEALKSAQMAVDHLASLERIRGRVTATTAGVRRTINAAIAKATGAA